MNLRGASFSLRPHPFGCPFCPVERTHSGPSGRASGEALFEKLLKVSTPTLCRPRALQGIGAPHYAASTAKMVRSILRPPGDAAARAMLSKAKVERAASKVLIGSGLRLCTCLVKAVFAVEGGLRARINVPRDSVWQFSRVGIRRERGVVRSASGL